MRLKNIIAGLIAVSISAGGLCILGIKNQAKIIEWYCHGKGGDDMDVQTCIDTHTDLGSLANSQN